MDKRQYTVDRIENDYVVLEIDINNLINVKKSYIIGDIIEGDILIKRHDCYFIDEIATQIRREKIKSMMKGLWEE